MTDLPPTPGMNRELFDLIRDTATENHLNNVSGMATFADELHDKIMSRYRLEHRRRNMFDVKVEHSNEPVGQVEG